MIRSLLFMVNDRAENLLYQDAGHALCDQVGTCHWSSMQLLPVMYHNACGTPCHDKSYHKMKWSCEILEEEQSWGTVYRPYATWTMLAQPG